MSDCGAINSITDHHVWTGSHTEGFAAALKAGTDLACTDYSHIKWVCGLQVQLGLCQQY